MENVSGSLLVETHDVVVAKTDIDVAVVVDGQVFRVDAPSEDVREGQVVRLLEAMGLDFIAELLTGEPDPFGHKDDDDLPF